MKKRIPWPIEAMIAYYHTDGMSLQEIADILSGDTWRQYWIDSIGYQYKPHQKIVNKVLRKHTTLRKRGAPGDRNGAWKGGRRTDRNGYILVYMPNHPHACESGCVREHRLVVEQQIGRYLTPSEVVHHKDGNKRNNSPDNLEVCSSNAEHIADNHKNQHTEGQRRGLGLARLAKKDLYDPELMIPKNLLLSLHSDGLSANQIGALLECDRRTVRRHLRRHGVSERHLTAGTVTDQHRERCRQALSSRIQ